MSPDELKVATFSGVKVSQCLKSIVYMRGNLYLSAIILFFFLSNAVYPFFILLVKYSCIVNILFTLNSHLFPIFNIPFFILTFFSLFSVVSLVSVVSVAKKSTLYTNEMQPAVFLPVYFTCIQTKCNPLFFYRCILVIIIAHYMKSHWQKQQFHFTFLFNTQNQIWHSLTCH